MKGWPTPEKKTRKVLCIKTAKRKEMSCLPVAMGRDNIIHGKSKNPKHLSCTYVGHDSIFFFRCKNSRKGFNIKAN